MRESQARYIMVGGFLGAGKTTAILKLAEYLTQNGRKVGLITNDQAAGLVDTAMARASKFPVEEIAGGCFCCRFDSLVEASQRLHESARPDVMIAEPVGSCTDLVATVALPLRQLYGESYRVSPLSVLMDPIRAMRILGIGDGRQFSPKVLYIYRKQLEEADFLVINKCDLLGAEQIAKLEQALKENFPRAEVFVISARSGAGLEAWFDRCMTATTASPGLMELDYFTYGAGEAMLGWLNASVQLRASEASDGNRLVRQFAELLRTKLAQGGIEVAHLKMTLAPAGNPFDIAVVNLVRTEGAPEISFELADPITDAELTVNLRAEAQPGLLEDAVRGVAADLSGEGTTKWTIATLTSFQPGQPNPTHRRDAAGVEHPPVLPLLSGAPPECRDTGILQSSGQRT